jgi:hypothetical protein
MLGHGHTDLLWVDEISCFIASAVKRPRRPRRKRSLQRTGSSKPRGGGDALRDLDTGVLKRYVKRVQSLRGDIALAA